MKLKKNVARFALFFAFLFLLNVPFSTYMVSASVSAPSTVMPFKAAANDWSSYRDLNSIMTDSSIRNRTNGHFLYGGVLVRWTTNSIGPMHSPEGWEFNGLTGFSFDNTNNKGTPLQKIEIYCTTWHNINEDYIDRMGATGWNLSVATYDGEPAYKYVWTAGSTDSVVADFAFSGTRFGEDITLLEINVTWGYRVTVPTSENATYKVYKGSAVAENLIDVYSSTATSATYVVERGANVVIQTVPNTNYEIVGEADSVTFENVTAHKTLTADDLVKVKIGHVFSDTWTQDGDLGHYHACTLDECNLTIENYRNNLFNGIEYSAHHYNRYVCAECEYEDIPGAKAAASAELEAEVGDDTAANVQEAMELAQGEVEEAETVDAIFEARDRGVDEIRRCKQENFDAALAQAQEDAIDELEATVVGDPSEAMEAILDEERDKIRATEDPSEIPDILEAAKTRVTDQLAAEALAKAKADACAAIETAAGTERTDGMRVIVEDAEDAIDEATSIEDVMKIKANCLVEIGQQKVKDTLQKAKDDAKAEIAAAAGEERSEEMWDIVNSVYDAINNALTVDAVAAAKTAGLSDIEARLEVELFLTAQADAKAEIAEAAGETASIAVASLAEAAYDAIDRCETFEDIDREKEAVLAAIAEQKQKEADALALAQAKADAKAEIERQRGKNPSEEIKTAIADAEEAILAAESISAVNDLKTAALRTIETIRHNEEIAALRAAAKDELRTFAEADVTGDFAVAIADAEAAIDSAADAISITVAKDNGIEAIRALRVAKELLTVKETAKAVITLATGRNASDRIREIAENGKAQIDACKTAQEIEDAKNYTLRAIEAQKKLEEEPEHTHVFILVPGQEPKDGLDGWKDCYFCSCGIYAETESGEPVISDYASWKLGAGSIPYKEKTNPVVIVAIAGGATVAAGGGTTFFLLRRKKRIKLLK